MGPLCVWARSLSSWWAACPPPDETPTTSDPPRGLTPEPGKPTMGLTYLKVTNIKDMGPLCVWARSLSSWWGACPPPEETPTTSDPPRGLTPEPGKPKVGLTYLKVTNMKDMASLCVGQVPVFFVGSLPTARQNPDDE